MPTDLLDLPGYPGHDQVQVFADDCLLGVSDDTRADPVALRAELNRRVALLSEDQVESLAALSPQTRKLRLRVLLNRISPAVYNDWSAEERIEQLQWRGSHSTTPQGQRMRWSAWYGFVFDEAGTAEQDEERAPAADEERAPAADEQAPAADEPPATELVELCRRAGLGGSVAAHRPSTAARHVQAVYQR